MYIDIHTHSFQQRDGVISIESVFDNFDKHHFNERKISAGIHPWYIEEENIYKQFDSLEKLIQKDNVIAIGECGLDKVKGSNFHLQKEVFQYQISLAEKYQKPLIIHCVKAFSDVFSLLKKRTIPAIIHGVNNKYSSLQPFVDQGFYLSFGKRIFYDNKAIMDTFQHTPLSQIFLETDDSNVDIISIYEKAAQLKNISTKELILHIQNNFQTIFNLK